MKIEYINKRPAYAKAVVSVVDHVECRCQPAPVPKKKSSRRQHSHQHRNQTLSQEHGQGQVPYSTNLPVWSICYFLDAINTLSAHLSHAKTMREKKIGKTNLFLFYVFSFMYWQILGQM